MVVVGVVLGLMVGRGHRRLWFRRGGRKKGGKEEEGGFAIFRTLSATLPTDGGPFVVVLCVFFLTLFSLFCR